MLAGVQQKETPITKCWNTPVKILYKTGISSDANNAYFVTETGHLQAIDAKTGETVWATELGGTTDSPILVGKRSLIVISAGAGSNPTNPGVSVIRSISATTGITNWRTELPFAESYFAGVTDLGVIVVTSRLSVISFNEIDGSVSWRATLEGTLSADPEIHARQITIATANNKLEVFDAADGGRLHSLGLKSSPNILRVASGPAAIVTDEKGGVASINLDNSRQNWKFKAGGKVTEIQKVNGKLLIASADNFVYLISDDTGKVVWKRRLPGRIASFGSIDPETVAVTVIGERTAYLINADNGKFTDQIVISPDDEFLLIPIRANGSSIIVATTNGISGYSPECSQEKSGKRIAASNSL